MKPLTRMSVFSAGFNALYANQTSIVDCQYKAGQIIIFWMKWVVKLWPNFKRLGKIYDGACGDSASYNIKFFEQ